MTTTNLYTHRKFTPILKGLPLRSGTLGLELERTSSVIA